MIQYLSKVKCATIFSVSYITDAHTPKQNRTGLIASHGRPGSVTPRYITGTVVVLTSYACWNYSLKRQVMKYAKMFDEIHAPHSQSTNWRLDRPTAVIMLNMMVKMPPMIGVGIVIKSAPTFESNPNSTSITPHV